MQTPHVGTSINSGSGYHQACLVPFCSREAAALRYRLRGKLQAKELPNIQEASNMAGWEIPEPKMGIQIINQKIQREPHQKLGIFNCNVWFAECSTKTLNKAACLLQPAVFDGYTMYCIVFDLTYCLTFCSKFGATKPQTKQYEIIIVHVWCQIKPINPYTLR